MGNKKLHTDNKISISRLPKGQTELNSPQRDLNSRHNCKQARPVVFILLLSKLKVWWWNFYYFETWCVDWMDMDAPFNMSADFTGIGIHYSDVIMGAIASQITSLTIVYSTIYSDTDQIKHQRSASLAFVRGIHQGPVNSPHKWPVTQKMFPFDDAIMPHYKNNMVSQWSYLFNKNSSTWKKASLRSKSTPDEKRYQFQHFASMEWNKVCRNKVCSNLKHQELIYSKISNSLHLNSEYSMVSITGPRVLNHTITLQSIVLHNQYRM